MHDVGRPDILTIAWLLLGSHRATHCALATRCPRGARRANDFAPPVSTSIRSSTHFTHARFQRKLAVARAAAEGHSAGSPRVGHPRRVRGHLAGQAMRAICDRFRCHPPRSIGSQREFQFGFAELVDASPVPLRWFIVDAGAITDLDYSAARTITDLVNALYARRIGVLFGRVNRYLHADMACHRITEIVGASCIFPDAASGARSRGRDACAAGAGCRVAGRLRHSARTGSRAPVGRAPAPLDHRGSRSVVTKLAACSAQSRPNAHA